MDFSDFQGTAVFDSNIWVFGITRQLDLAEQLIDRVAEGMIQVKVSAYIYDEVYEAFDRSLSGERVGEAKHDFSEFVFDSPCVESPTQEQLREMDLTEVRSQPEIKMMGRVLDIQPKDVPVVVLAWQYWEESPVVFTADKPFSKFLPSDHNLSMIEMSYVSV